MVEESSAFDVTKNSQNILNEASLIAKYFLDVGQQEINISKLKEEIPSLQSFDASKITSLFKTFVQPANRNNILLSGLIFYVISKGKYPQDVWLDALKNKEETKLFSFKEKFNSYINALGNDFAPANSKADFNNIVKEFKRTQIMPLIKEDERVPGLVCLFETIYETFVEKYDKYAPRIYNKLFDQYKDKKFHKREGTECIEQKLNAYSVSFAGNMDKPGHADCEDFSFVRTLDKKGKVFLIAVCDGVGSAIDSETGSKCACEALEMVIVNYLRRTEKALRKKGYCSNTIRNYSILMPMLQYDLATDVYFKWAKLVRQSPSYQAVKKQKPEMDQFTSTMQFALITPLFVCTGKVGDGSFYIRKKEKNGKNDLDGIFCLTDGRSDVLEKGVLNMAVLDTNPRSLQINFYRTDEVKDILITSDGVSPIFKDDLFKAYRIMRDLYLLPYKDRITQLEKMARNGSDVNTVDYSSGGDDASIAYVSFGNEE